MKIFKKLIIFALLMALIATGANATFLEISEINFKGEIGETKTVEFEVTNKIDSPLEIVNIKHNLDSKYEAKLQNNIIGTELKKGETKRFTITIKIPQNAKTEKIGKLEITAHNFFIPGYTCKLETNINLEVIGSQGESETQFSDYIEINDVKITGAKGETIKTQFTITNKAGTGNLQNYDLENIRISTNSNYGVSFNPTAISKISPGKTETIDIEITIPIDIEITIPAHKSEGNHKIGKIIVRGDVATGEAERRTAQKTTDIELTVTPPTFQITNIEFKGKHNDVLLTTFDITYNGEKPCFIQNAELTGLSNEFGADFKQTLIDSLYGQYFDKGYKKTFSMNIIVPNSYQEGKTEIGKLKITTYESFSKTTRTAQKSINLEVEATQQQQPLKNPGYLQISQIKITGIQGLKATAKFTISTPTGSSNTPPTPASTTFQENFRIENIIIKANTDLTSKIIPSTITKLDKGQSTEITIEITIPNDKEKGDYNIGTLNVEGELFKECTVTDGNDTQTYFCSAGKTETFTNINLEVEDATTQFTISETSLGSSTTERGQNATNGKLTITNTGTATLTNFQFSTTAHSKYKIDFENKPTTLNPGNSIDVQVTGYIPLDLDSGTTKIGTISVTANTKTETTDLKITAPNKLLIDRIKITYNEKTITLKEGTTISDIKPGTLCSIEITVSNKNNKNSGLDFEDVEITADGKDSDLEGDTETIDIDAGQQETITIDLEIDSYIESGEYDAFVKAESKDTNNAKHFAELNFKIKIEKPDNEIQIKSIKITPTNVNVCSVSEEIMLEIRIYNNGKKRERNAGVEIRIPGISYTKTINQLTMDEGEYYTIRETIVIPKDTKPGKYNILVISKYDEKDSEIKNAEFTVLNTCTTQTTTQTETNNQKQQTNEQTTTATTQTKTGLKDAMFGIILILANIIVATALVILTVKLFKNIKKLR